jgi:hypothetical protein
VWLNWLRQPKDPNVFFHRLRQLIEWTGAPLDGEIKI